VTGETFDRDFWEARWAQALREHRNAVANRPPNAHFVAEIADLVPGIALDAGCGNGSEAVWLAASGWRVTAVDVSATGEPSPAAGQTQVTVEQARHGLDSQGWTIVVGEERTRAGGSGVDAVVRAIHEPSRY
jgi:SAM-dependent methyltransferase